MSKSLEDIESPDDLRMLTVEQLDGIARELRQTIIEVVSRNGGHLSSNLGVVELTLALHYCYDFLKDRLIWDVGHQAYAHKILTGRREEFPTLRQQGGISGFADRRESPYDPFTFGHTATSISAGLGLSCAKSLLRKPGRTVAVVGDGAIASGMAFEALNHAAEVDEDLLLVLNDNEMSISRSVGGIARYLSKIRSSGPYVDMKQEAHDLLGRWRPVFKGVDKLYGRISEGIQSALTPGGLFVEMGIHYYGPVDGHDTKELVATLRHLKRIEGPALLHIITQKGKGFRPAREDPAAFHSSGKFELQNGKIQPPAEEAEAPEESQQKPPRWSSVMGRSLLEMARKDDRLVAITAAMRKGTGLSDFADRYPDRFYDVGICEQHGLGFAGGLAAGGLRPVVCIYSTFLQRAHDQLFHDVALQKAPVVLGVDRAGLVGSDGPTHHGLYDISFMRCLPGFVVMAPGAVPELRRMLELAFETGRPSALRYPREEAPAEFAGLEEDFALGQAAVLRSGDEGAIIAYGAMVHRALKAADILAEKGVEITVVNARFVKPLDLETIREVVAGHQVVLTAEDHAAAGGFGSAVLEALVEEGVPTDHVRVAGVPDRFIPHARREKQLVNLRLDGPGLAGRLEELLQDNH